VSVSSLVGFGLPPRGLGAYVWQGEVPPGAWDFFAVQYTSRTLLRSLLDAGRTCWAFGGPSHWTPSTWRATLATIDSMIAADPRIAGLVANPEESWRSASADEARAFGEALAARSRRYRVGVVTIPSQPHLATLVAAAGDGVWWSIELYAHTAPPASFGAHAARWLAMIPRARFSVTPAGFVPPTDLGRRTMATRESYRAYVDALPASSSAIVWGNNRTLRERPWMLEELRRRFGALSTVPLAIAGFLTVHALALASLVAVLVLAALVGPMVV
jgi:hypothetical protein